MPTLPSVTHYEDLGVAPTATAAEMRRAYVDLARRHHPDRAGSTAADSDRMREINAAWAVLGDPDLRVVYDRRLADGPRFERRGSGAPKVHRSSVGRSFRRSPVASPRSDNATSPGWVPIDDHRDDEVPDLTELLDDTPVPGTEVPRWMQVVPPYLLCLAIVSLIIGLVVSLPEVLALGIGAFVLSIFSFVAVPVFAIFTSRSHDLDP